mgnify:FL=1
MIINLLLWPFKITWYIMKLILNILFWPFMFLLNIINGTSNK